MNTRVSLNQTCSAVLLTLFNTTSPYAMCPRNHVTHNFFACDQHSRCSTADISFRKSRESWSLPSKHWCTASTASLPPSFMFTSGEDHVPYTLVCDFHQDCLDNSDEDFCVFPECDAQQFQCESNQCVAIDELCNGFVNCLDETDEWRCNIIFHVNKVNEIPALITLNGRGNFTAIKLLDWNSPCPDTHFKCLSIEFCMPVYVHCNGVNDCPEKEDEEGCDDYRSCPGFYRCRGFKNIFLHPEHLCDGWAQCPQRDDERFCNLTCPSQCSCFGYSGFCIQVFRAHLYPLIRFLDAENSGVKPSYLHNNAFLIHLSLSKFGVVDFKHFILPNLHSLDLEGNQIQVVTDLNGLPNLNTLFLTGNPLISLFGASTKLNVSFQRLIRLDLSNVKIKLFNSSILASFPNLQTLNLSGCDIENISKPVFDLVPKLRVLDLHGCRLSSFPTEFLKPLKRLRTVSVDSFKLCCPIMLPTRFRSKDCKSPEEKVASCADLFKSKEFRASWYTTTSMALLCNIAMLFIRLNGHYRRIDQKSPVDVFITSLFVCGCIHAVYMAIIGLADASYRGDYTLHDTAWTLSPLCAAAGFLWLLSVEMSLFLIGLMTLDRVLSLWSPLRSTIFSVKSAVAAICVLTLEGVIIASVPVFMSLSQRKLFQHTPLCSPLLLDSQNFTGGHYLFGIFSVVNVAVSWFVGLGQLSLYVCLHRKRFAFVQSPNETEELSITRRVMALVICDIVFWLGIGHSTHLVVSGMTVSSNVVVLAQVLVMSLNWTLKPVLYAVTALFEHRRQNREARILKVLIAKRHD